MLVGLIWSPSLDSWLLLEAFSACQAILNQQTSLGWFRQDFFRKISLTKTKKMSTEVPLHETCTPNQNSNFYESDPNKTESLADMFKISLRHHTADHYCVKSLRYISLPLCAEPLKHSGRWEPRGLVFIHISSQGTSSIKTNNLELRRKLFCQKRSH